MKHYLFVLIVFLICGCSSKPSDVPELYPCQVTVTNGDTPISRVDVILGLMGKSSSCSMHGTTNSSGVAIIYTKRLAWQGKGAPAGDYIVTLEKPPQSEGDLSLAEYQKLDPMEQARYSAEQARKFDALPREVPIELSEFSVSPYRLTVSGSGGNHLEIDIATFKPSKKK